MFTFLLLVLMVLEGCYCRTWHGLSCTACGERGFIVAGSSVLEQSGQDLEDVGKNVDTNNSPGSGNPLQS